MQLKKHIYFYHKNLKENIELHGGEKGDTVVLLGIDISAS
jgi:hypothetical protein